MINAPWAPGTEIFKHVQYVREGCFLKPIPLCEQDGGWEIHPALEGISFKFWVNLDNPRECWVNFSGDAPQAPWACYLTGVLATEGGVSEAKRYLRQQAWTLAEKAGFKFDPEKHGYRWL